MHFYTNVQIQGNKILVRGVKDGKKYQAREDFAPTLFVKTEEDNGWRTIYNENVGPVRQGDIQDARDFVKQYKDVSNYPIYGQTDFRYQYITENFPEPRIDFDARQIHVETIDIETSVEFGFPTESNPIEEILLITLQNKATKEITTFGVQPFDVASLKHVKNAAKATYIQCKNEKDLLNQFLMHWRVHTPDILTGWNIKQFDIPYLVARIARVLGEKAVDDLSPWRKVVGSDQEIMGRMFRVYDIMGVSILDYLDLYKKFTYKARESYKLDFIAQAELGREKLKTEWATFKEHYENDWQSFVEYNMVDVELVDAIEDKKRIIELVIVLAYDAKCNYVDIFSPVRTWDCLIYNHLWQKQLVIPQKESSERAQIVGAFVKEPKPGMYKWVVSFDATSLYPSIMLAYNLSPDTIAEGEFVDGQIADFIARKPDLSFLKEKDLAMTANGQCFKRGEQGLFTEIVARIFEERQSFKKQMLVAAKEYEATKSEESALAKARYNVFQEARKILLNSLYGALGNPYFRFYDDRIAEGITLTGQFVLQSVMAALNEYLNKILKTQGVDYAFYGDTDSVYITLDGLVEAHYKDMPKEKVVDILDKICQEKIVGAINKACASLGDYSNSYDAGKIFFKREVIADTGVWVAKKRYALNVHDSEGVRYKEPELKVMGLEIVRSSTPAPVREHLKKAVKIVLTGNEKQLQAYIAKFEQEFKTMDPEVIAFPRGVNGLDKYGSSATIYIKGCPMHVRGALLFNNQLKVRGLEKQYELIREGDKIKFVYLREPNTLGQNVISFSSVLPKELDLHRYVDYNTMYETAFLNPLDTILKGIGWHAREQATLEDLFC